MLLPVVITMGVLVFYPLARGIAFSFTDADRYNIGGQDIPSTYSYIGLENYKTLDDDPNFWNVFKFTGVWTFVNVFFHFTIGLGLALMLNRSLRFRGTYRVLLLVPWAVPVFITALGWRYLYNVPNGFFDQLLRAIGIDGPAWLGDPTWAKVSVIAVNVWLGIPFMMVALLGGLQAIDKELLDAAAVDGASALRRFWDVTLPGLRPVAATVILLGIIWTFNLFAVIFLITQGGPADSTQILVTYSYRYFLDYQLYGVAAAYGVLIPLVPARVLDVLPHDGALDGRGELVPMAVDTHAAGRAARPRRRSGRGRGSSAGLHFTLIAATTIAIFPVLWILLSSFKPNEVIKTQTDLQVVPDPWTLENYRTVLTQNDYEFLHWLANSVVVALFTTVIGVFLAATAAYAFSRYRFPGYRAGLMALLVAQMFPGVILLVPIYKIVVDLGLLDTKASLVLAYTTFALPFCVWMLKGLLRHDPVLARGGRPHRRPHPVRDVLADRDAAEPARDRGDGVLHVHHRLERGPVRQRLPDRDRELHAAHRPAHLRLPVRAAVRLADGRCGHRDDSRHHRVPVRPALPGERADTRRGERVITHEASAPRSRARAPPRPQPRPRRRRTRPTRQRSRLQARSSPSWAAPATGSPSAPSRGSPMTRPTPSGRDRSTSRPAAGSTRRR